MRIVAIALLLSLAMTEAHSGSGESCEQEWLESSEKYVNQELPDFRGLLTFWQQRAKDCAGTGAYEARLAAIHVHLGEIGKARAELAKGKKHGSEYSGLIELTELLADAFEVTAAAVVDKSQLIAIADRSLAFAKRYPDFAEGLAFAGGSADDHWRARESHSVTGESLFAL